MTNESMQLPHKLTLNDRNKLTLTGVNEVLSFDEQAVTMRTTLGLLTVHGQNLQLKKLSEEGGQVAVEGTVSALIYEETVPERGWLRRLFR